MVFSDLDLSRRLERAEGQACLQFAEARRGLYPNSGATWIECAGAYAVFDGVDSPVTQSFGLGLFEPLTPSALDTMEAFFLDRGAVVAEWGGVNSSSSGCWSTQAGTSSHKS